MSQLPAMSVLMPVYNAGRFLQPAIDSVLSQSFGDFELLLIDDGSTDGSREVVSSQADPRVRPFLREHSGLVPVLNFGLRQARGELVARMDSDDLCLPQRLELQHAWMQAHDETVALGAAAQLIDGDGKPFGSKVLPGVEHEQIVYRLLEHDGGSGLLHPTVMLRRDRVLAIGGYRDAFPVCEDWDLWVRLSRVGKLHALPQVLLKLRKHGGNVTVTRMARNLQSVVEARVCHRIWVATGVDAVDEAPELWREIDARICQLLQKRRLLEMLTRRNRLKAGPDGCDDPRPLAVLRRLLANPTLASGLRFHRAKDRLVAAVVMEFVPRIAAAVRQPEVAKCRQ